MLSLDMQETLVTNLFTQYREKMERRLRREAVVHTTGSECVIRCKLYSAVIEPITRKSLVCCIGDAILAHVTIIQPTVYAQKKGSVLVDLTLLASNPAPGCESIHTWIPFHWLT